jgi:hypothetical protein
MIATYSKEVAQRAQQQVKQKVESDKENSQYPILRQLYAQLHPKATQTKKGGGRY